MNAKDLEKYWISDSTRLLTASSLLSTPLAISLLSKAPHSLRNGHFGVMSSGSTGKQTVVLGRKERSENLVISIHKAQHNEHTSNTICVLPLSYSYALINQWLWARVMGRQFVMTPGLSNPTVLKEVLDSANSAMVCFVASQIPLLKNFFNGMKFPGVLRINFAGERFPQEQLETMYSLFPNAEIFNNYGCTEAMPRLTIRHADDSDDAANIGRPLPGIELKTDAGGRLLFRSPFGAVATINEDGLRHIGPDDWVETGDFGEQCVDGSWRVLGRTNSVFKRFGEKVSVSRVIDELRGVWDGEIAGFTENDPAGAPGWSLVLAPEPADEEVRKILLALREAFTRPHWPIRIESMASLPRLPNGKIDLQALKDAENKKLHWRQRI